MSSKKEKLKDLKGLMKDWIDYGEKAKTKDDKNLNIDIVCSAVKGALSRKDISSLELKKMLNEVRAEEVTPYSKWEEFEDRLKRFNAIKSKLK